MDKMANDKKRGRRKHTAELKRQILRECEGPGVSVAKIALSHGINANIVHTWRRIERERKQKGLVASAGQAAAGFVALPLDTVRASTPTAPHGCIDIEVRRGALTMTVAWPLSAVAELANWTRELLR